VGKTSTMTKTTFIFISLLFYILPFRVDPMIDQDPLANQDSLPEKSSKEGHLNELINQAEKLYKTKRMQSVGEVIKDAFHYARENDLNIPYQLYVLEGKFALNQKNIFKAKEAISHALKLIKSDEKADKKLVIWLQNDYAKILFQESKYQESLDLYKANQKLAEQAGINEIVLESIHSLAIIYQTLGNLSDSKVQYKLLLEQSIVHQDTAWLIQALFRSGNIAMNSDSNFAVAEAFFKSGMKVCKASHNYYWLGWMMNHLAWNYYLMGQKDDALELYRESIELAKKNKQIDLVVNALGNIGTIYRDKKSYTRAAKYYQKSIEVAKSSRNLVNLRWIYMDASDMYKSMGDYKNAYENYVLYTLYNDSINSLKYQRSMDEARMKFDVDQQKKELEVLTLKLSQQQWFTYGAIAFVCLFILVSFLVIRQFRLSAKKRITEMNQQIAEMTQANLRQQMNPHFIFNTLNSIQYYMYQHDKVATNNYLTKFSSLIRKILENSQHTAIPLEDELEALRLYLDLERLRFKDKLTYSIEVDDSIDTLQTKIPTMLIQPYVENAICHGLVNKDAPGYVRILLHQDKGYISCIIEDNGIGRTAASEIKKQHGTTHNSLGTKITRSRLDVVNSLYGSSLEIKYTDLKDQEGNALGTRVEIHIPLMV
jgi:tetratricopeptide (TPR) repeat protein